MAKYLKTEFIFQEQNVAQKGPKQIDGVSHTCRGPKENVYIVKTLQSLKRPSKLAWL